MPSLLLDEKLQEIKGDFDELGNWTARYQHLVELGKAIPALNPSHRTEANQVQGCLAKVWLTGELQNGTMQYFGDSDGIVPKGLVALLITLFSGATPSEIALFNADLISELGLRQNLTPTRAQAFAKMVVRVRELAQIHNSSKM